MLALLFLGIFKLTQNRWPWQPNPAKTEAIEQAPAEEEAPAVVEEVPAEETPAAE